jgi:esterase/lipase
MNKIFKTTLVLFSLISSIYLLGPKVEDFTIDTKLPVVTSDIIELRNWVRSNEKNNKKIKKGNASEIIFFDSIPKKTKYSVLYLHGFSASSKEGDPVHKNVALSLKANLYLPRLYSHGLNESEPMLNFNNNDYWDSAKQALAIAKQLGEEVILLATSHGASVALNLESDPGIVALVLYSPNIEVVDYRSKLLSKPWGLQIARLVLGSKYHFMRNDSDEKKKYWTVKYRIEATTHMQNFINKTMVDQTFKVIEKPVFMGYYYKNDTLQDDVSSVEAMLKMFNKLGSSKKSKKAFPNSGDHVMTSYLTNQNHDELTLATLSFLDSAVLKH